MRRRDRAVYGPRGIDDADVDALNHIFADAFTDRYRRDGLVGVRVPKLNPMIWRYALRDAGTGAMVWTDDDDRIVAFNVAHCSGTEGWMGPLAVRTDHQGMGVGRRIVEAAIDWLRERHVRTVGLETMPRTVDNVGFYSQLGFRPEYLTVTVVGDVRAPSRSVPFTLLSEASPDERGRLVEACRQSLRRATGGYDFTNELELTEQLAIGDTIVIGPEPLRGFALWHSAPLVEGRAAEEVRLLKLYADSAETFDGLLTALEICAASTGLRRVAIRCQTAYAGAYDALIRRHYRVRWTDLRMTLAGYPAVRVGGDAVLLSNWEV